MAMIERIVLRAGAITALLCAGAACDAQPVTLLNERGLDSLLHVQRTKPLVMNLWATWCEPCREEFPDLIKAAKEYPNVEVCIVSADFPDEIDSKIRPFVKELKIPFPVFVSGFRKQEELIDRLDRKWNGALPATFVFTNNGVRDTFVVGRQSLAKFRSIFKGASSKR
jgi:thiol-disulfide isomerase/thioredoxin